MNTFDYIKALQDRVSDALRSRLDNPGLSPRLEEAMQYAVNNGGKRIRPILVYASAETVGGNLRDADDCACAVEFIHAYSLIHDDLPAMDDDELRRGQPTCHVKYDEATAILAGDALQSLAFELLASGHRREPALTVDMIATLARASGWQGMVGGQSIDIEGVGDAKNEQDLALMHGLKTGALISASVRLGALSSGRATEEQLAGLDTFASCMGLAFQIKDDILDVESDTDTLGKQQGKDESNNKPTYPAVLGLEGARDRMLALYEQGTMALDIFGVQSINLRGIADYIINRKY